MVWFTAPHFNNKNKDSQYCMKIGVFGREMLS